MILVIDAGNSRIKWGVQDETGWLAQGALAHGELARLREVALAHRGVRQVLGANVAGSQVGAAVTAALEGLAPAPRWLTASPACCGVRNGYERPAQLGPDRWAALVGARSLHRGACLVVTAGTATTVDLLAGDGDFRGGLILPGEELMRRALALNTAELPLAEGRFAPTPRCTADAIASGCLNAQAGAVERMFAQIAAEPGALCLLGGGGAPRLAPLLGHLPLRRVENLVLEGLAVIANEARNA